MGRTVVLVPTELKRIPTGLWTHAACRPSAVVLSNLIGLASRFWLWPLRAGATEWNPPFGFTEWAAWAKQASDSVGAEVGQWLVIPSASPHRRRFAMILLDEQRRQRAFVKWSRNPPNELALAAEERLVADPPAYFVAPTLVDHGTVEGWSYTINEALPPGPHRPAALTAGDRRALVEEIHERLRDLGPTDSVVGHGDFAPWNVRELSSGQVAVIDWEQVGPTPVATDELWHVITMALATGKSVEVAVSRAVNELVHHDASTLHDAASFLAGREDRQPPETDDSIPRSASLLGFESRISEALQRLQG